MRSDFETESGMAFGIPMIILLMFASLVMYVFVAPPLNGFVVAVMSATSDTMSQQTANTISNTLFLFGNLPVIIIIGYLTFSFVNANNFASGNGGDVWTPWRGGVVMITMFILSVGLAFLLGISVDSIEATALDPSSPVSDIPDDWKNAQNAAQWSINLLMLIPFFTQAIGASVFVQSLFARTTRGYQWG